jgi:hypothetical protein
MGDGDQATLVMYAQPSNQIGRITCMILNRHSNHAPSIAAIISGAIIIAVYW